MRKNRAIRGAVGIGVAALISVGVGAPVALGQYGEEPPPTTVVGGTTTTTTPSNKLLLKKCIAKAQTKFGDNKPKRKKAIRKCKKKYKT